MVIAHVADLFPLDQWIDENKATVWSKCAENFIKNRNKIYKEGWEMRSRQSKSIFPEK